MQAAIQSASTVHPTPRWPKMKYTLITASGRVYTFYVEALALQFQQAYGGQVITADILVDSLAKPCYN